MDHLQKLISNSLLASHWKQIGINKHHGINLPLFALHSQNSSGIGEFYDLLPIIDWCHDLKLDVIQLLPLNDSGDDPSPYFITSSCAINPLFLSLGSLPFLDKFPALKKKLESLKLLTKSERIHYADVQSQKTFWLREYFELVGSLIIKTNEFNEFIKHNSTWIEPYALFKTLKSIVSKNHWLTWPEELKNPSPQQFQTLLEHHHVEVSFHLFLQYLCSVQLEKVKKYANSKKILILGDIPILISPDSADVWQYPELFDLSLSAGAPPDIYNSDGQVWGLPIFHWDAMKKNKYNWWKQRLKFSNQFFDIYRIDHVLGFFRLWAIPINRPGKEGKFIPEDKIVWEENGREILEMLIKNSTMLPIAEDLGDVPDIVPKVLSEMGICGTAVMRWERYWKQDKQFIPIQNYNPLSLTTVSTHDSETLQLWWRDLPEESKFYAAFKHWTYSPALSKMQRREILWDSHHTSSIFHVNLLQEYLALFPELIFDDPTLERINVPGKILPTNWTYRFRPSVEELTTHGGLKEEMLQIVSAPSPAF